MELGIVLGIAGLLVTVAALCFAIYTHLNKSVTNKKPGSRCLNRYRKSLRMELGRIGVVGPGFETITAPTRETFTYLRISEAGRGEMARDFEDGFQSLYLSPEEIIERAFRDYRLLLLIGDPGSGKTTLLKYYAVTCLDKKQATLGFGKKKIIPLFLPLRELKFAGEEPLSLHENLAAWAKKNHMDDMLPADFYYWLKNRRTLVLLDGLDEINDTQKRIRVCEWIKHAWTGFDKACFVLTTRPTGFRKSQGIELECEHLQGDIMDFDRQQQETFLNRWFKAVSLTSLKKETAKKEKQAAECRAEKRAAEIIAFLNREENKSVRELARVPMLLQIMAIIWRDRDFLPGSRSELYEVSLDYLLDYRDRHKKISSLLSSEKARIALTPAALWLQETLRSDNAPAADMHKFLQPILDTLEKQPQAEEFCRNLRDRAGLIVDYGEGSYIFRHKSFMEYLGGLQLVKDCTAKPRRIKDAVRYFFDPWWQETLRFFFSKSDDVIFDSFMKHFFAAPDSENLDQHRQDLLQYLVQDAPQKRTDALVQWLMKPGLSTNRARYILDCLETIDTPEAVKAVAAFIKKTKAEEHLRKHAADILAEYDAERSTPAEKRSIEEQLVKTATSFRSPFEDNVEYIKIPGGSYRYSITKKMETVPPLFFCKYPVTNKRYRRFISYLGGDEKDLQEILPQRLFAEKLMEFSEIVTGYSRYLGKQTGEWQDKFRSRLDEDKRFKGDDQPVVGVTWYASRSYCFWLSCLQAAAQGIRKLPGMKELAEMFRLPMENEWEWAAAGREKDGSLREYPWPKTRGEPTPELANYDKNVGATTPVGRYPQGATPEGLLDMAGNVWEWQGNYFDKDTDSFALRGACWWDEASSLCCVSRLIDFPDSLWYSFFGFRVVCPNP